MAFGFSPKHSTALSITALSKEEAFVIALNTAEKLDWNISLLSENGFIAYTKFSMSSWSEEVRIQIAEGRINLKSECTGSQLMDFGKNKKNTDAFIETFNRLKSIIDSEAIASRFSDLEKEFVSEEEDIINKPPLSQKEKISDFRSLFKPRKDYFITPILLDINSIIFIIMIISGVHIMLPENEILLTWGANFRPLTLNGEWWRLISSCFLHIGILHLLFNMYALLYIGLILEPYLGKSRFLSAYLITGIAGSLTSLYWNELTISAGASGAIFGMYGVFLAMLTTNLIEKSARKAFVTSIVVFVGFSLLNGLKGGIDNAAHVGGLVSGLIVGYTFYPSLIKPKMPQLKVGSIGLLSLITLAASFAILTTTGPGDISKYETEMEQFSLSEEKALSIYTMSEDATVQEYLDEINNTGIPSWESNLRLLERVEKLDLPEIIHDRNLKLKKYCNLRLKTYELIYKGFVEGSDSYQNDIEAYNIEIESIIDELTQE